MFQPPLIHRVSSVVPVEAIRNSRNIIPVTSVMMPPDISAAKTIENPMNPNFYHEYQYIELLEQVFNFS